MDLTTFKLGYYSAKLAFSAIAGVDVSQSLQVITQRQTRRKSGAMQLIYYGLEQRMGFSRDFCWLS